MHKFYREHIIADRLKQVGQFQKRIDMELDALSGNIDKVVLEVLLEIQNELGYKWSFFSGLMHSSLAYYVCGITSINPMIFDFDFELYCNEKLNVTPTISIELPPDVELTDFTVIAEKFGYIIIKEDNLFNTENEIYSFINLKKNISGESWLIEKTEVKVNRNNVNYLINSVFRVMHKPEFILGSMRITPSKNKGWDRIARGAILKYFKDLPIDLIDFYFDYEVDNFDKLANFIVLCDMNKRDSPDETQQSDRNENFKLDDNFVYEKSQKSKTKLKIMISNITQILSAGMSKGYKKAYDLFLLSHLEYCYPKEFKKGMGDVNLKQY